MDDWGMTFPLIVLFFSIRGLGLHPQTLKNFFKVLLSDLLRAK